MIRTVCARSGSPWRAALAAGCGWVVGGGLGARFWPARRVVERVVETGSGRRWRGLSGACTFAGSSSRNLRSEHPAVQMGGVL